MEMAREELLAGLAEIAGAENVCTNEQMSRHTTFRIGGAADYFVAPASAEELQGVVRFLNKRDVPFYVIGNGSNLLVSDRGIRGAVVQLYGRFSRIEVLHADSGCGSAVDKAGRVYLLAQAGASLAAVGSYAAELSLEGFEFASGIPGTVGGAVVMNAGAYGREIKDVLVRATVMEKATGNVLEVDAEDMDFDYRTSSVEGNGWIVLDAVIALKPGNRRQIQEYMAQLAESRRQKQPLNYPSAGSTFKRPEGHFAGKLIEDAGFKGFSAGGAQISEKHAGFVINTGNASAKDVIELTDRVAAGVFERYGVKLELEIRLLGF